MSHEKLHYMKECLIHYVEQEMCNLPEADANELGEAIDMIKDLEEAIYYCTITEAMNSDKQKDYEIDMREYEEAYNGQSRMYYGGGSRNMYKMPRMDEKNRPWEDDRMYQDRGRSNGNGNSSNSSSSGMGNYSESWMPRERDYREGKSPESRRMYMEGRTNGNDKANQLRELEKYMQELSSDIVEMIQEASSDEKQYLEKKLVALSSKIGQMK